MPDESPWLDLGRRPQRRYLRGLRASAQPMATVPSVVGMLEHRVRERWSAHLGIAPASILICCSLAQALHLLANAVLLPGDTVRLAQPGQLAWSAAVLSAGAAFVDVGRLSSGVVDPATRSASPSGRLAILGAPAPTGAQDAPSWPHATAELRVADASLAANLAGVVCAQADLTIIHLRDPVSPAAPLLTAIVGAEADITALQYLTGPVVFPELLIRGALAALGRVNATADADFADLLHARSAELSSLLTLGPGQRWLPAAGISRVVACLAADGLALAQSATVHGFPAEAWSAFPGGGLVRCALL